MSDEEMSMLARKAVRIARIAADAETGTTELFRRTVGPLAAAVFTALVERERAHE